LEFAHGFVFLQGKYSLIKSKSKMKLTPAQIDSIAQDLQSDMRCFVHRLTGEVVTVLTKEGLGATDRELWQEELDKLEEGAPHFFEFEKMGSHLAFQVMEDFAEMAPRPLKIRLLTALEKHKPFAHFRQVIDHEDEWRERWFAYQHERNMEWVEQQVSLDNEGPEA
jgi:hypothetical protein